MESIAAVASNGVASARSGGYQHYARLARCPGIAVGGMRSTLLVPDQDMLQVVVVKKLIVNREYCSARITEYGIHIEIS